MNDIEVCEQDVWGICPECGGDMYYDGERYECFECGNIAEVEE